MLLKTGSRNCPELRYQFPPRRSLDTVDHRKFLTFHRIHIISKMGVQGKHHLIPGILVRLNLIQHIRDNGPGLRAAQRSIHKILLHIHHYK